MNVHTIKDIYRCNIKMEPNLQEDILQQLIIDKIDDLKGQDVITINVKDKSSITDWMIICTGSSNRHVNSIATHIIDAAKAAGVKALGIDGEKEGSWIVVDFNEVIVHIMQDEARQLYQLEKLWS